MKQLWHMLRTFIPLRNNPYVGLFLVLPLMGADLRVIQPGRVGLNIQQPKASLQLQPYTSRTADECVETAQVFSLLNYYPGWYFATQIQANTFSFPYRLQWPIGAFPAFVLLTNATPQDISGGAITATFRVVATPDAVFRFGGQGSWNTGTLPPHARLFFSSYHGYLAENAHPEWSWWSQEGWVAITNGVFTITAALNPLRWNDSYAGQDTNAFLSALTNVIECGVSFGGGNFYDIGVGMTAGNATFEMLALDFLPGTGTLSLNLTNGLNRIESSTTLTNWCPYVMRVGPGTLRIPVGTEPYRFWRTTAL